jgi:hypothetical protein
MSMAAEHGNLNLVEKFHAWGAIDLHLAMAGAAEHGHLNLVEKFHEWGVTEFGLSIEKAASSGHIDIVEKLVGWDNNRIWCAIIHANRAGNLELLERLLGSCTRIGKKCDFDEVLYEASYHGHLYIVEKCIEWGSTDFTRALAFAAHGNLVTAVIEKLVQLGATACMCMRRGFFRSNVLFEIEDILGEKSYCCTECHDYECDYDSDGELNGRWLYDIHLPH